MEFYYIMYGDYDIEDSWYESVEITKSRGIGLNTRCYYFLNVGKNYKIEDNKIIIDDEFLNKKKRKVVKKRLGEKTHLREFLVDDVLQWNSNYILYLEPGYFIATSLEDINEDDIKLTPNEWIIKKLIE